MHLQTDSDSQKDEKIQEMLLRSLDYLMEEEKRKQYYMAIFEMECG